MSRIMVAMVIDKPVMAWDMSTIASSRRSMAWRTRVNDSCSHGVRIVVTDGWERSRVWWG